MGVGVFLGLYCLANTPLALTIEKYLEPATGGHEEVGLALELGVLMISTILSLTGFFTLARDIKLEGWTVSISNAFNWLKPALDNKWYIDRIHNYWIVQPLLAHPAGSLASSIQR